MSENNKRSPLCFVWLYLLSCTYFALFLLVFSFFSCTYCLALQDARFKCEVCSQTACYECFVDNEWHCVPMDRTSVCKGCLPVIKATKRCASPTKLTLAKRAKRDAKFKIRLAKNMVKVAKQNVLFAKKNASLAFNLEKEKGMTPKALAKKREKANARLEQRELQRDVLEESCRQRWMLLPMSKERLWS